MGLCAARRGEPNNAEVASDVHRCSRVELAMFDMIGRLPIAAGSRNIRNCPRYVRQARVADLAHVHSEEMFEDNRTGGGPRRAIEPQKDFV